MTTCHKSKHVAIYNVIYKGYPIVFGWEGGVLKELQPGSLRLSFSILRLAFEELQERLSCEMPLQDGEVTTIKSLSVHLHNITITGSYICMNIFIYIMNIYIYIHTYIYIYVCIK